MEHKNNQLENKNIISCKTCPFLHVFSTGKQKDFVCGLKGEYLASIKTGTLELDKCYFNLTKISLEYQDKEYEEKGVK